MKSLIATLLAFLAGGTLVEFSALFQQQEKAQAEDPEDALLPPFKRFLAREKKRLSEEILGNWILMDFKDPNAPLANELYDGWAVFDEGYLTMFLQMRALENGFLREVERRYFQVGAHRYRFNDDNALQTASILGSTNLNEGRDFEFEPSGFPREFQIELKGDSLRMVNRDLITFEFRRVKETVFPENAVLELQHTR